MAEESFSLCLPRQVLFGPGVLGEAIGRIQKLGRRIFLIAGKRSRTEKVEEFIALLQRSTELSVFPGPGREPQVEDLDRAVAAAREFKPEAVVGVGGGSVLDLAKATSALTPNRHGQSSAEFLEGVEGQKKIEADPLPFVAVPTTAGTGSEATRNAVISWPEKKLKRSIRDERMVAALAVIDPELTYGLPRVVTVSSGMDALTQLLEAFICRRANPFTDGLALEGLRIGLPAFRRLIRDMEDREARRDMALASFLSGVCLGNAGLGIVHAVAPSLGLLFGIPHGRACAALLSFGLEFNRQAARKKLARVWWALGGKGDEEEASQALVREIKDLSREVGIPQRLRELGVTEKDLPALAQYASGNSLRANPIPLRREELAEVLKEIL